VSQDLLALGIEELGLDLSQENVANLDLFLHEMARWNQVHNLTAIEGEQESIRLHLIDSIAVLPVMREFLQGTSPQIADLGSGGGLPAIPIAILQPEWCLTLIEAVRKKTAFLQHVRGRLKLKNIEVLSERVEVVAVQQPAQFDAVISRAFTSLARFLELSLPLLKPGGLVFAMKGKKADEEMQEVCLDAWRLVLDAPLQIPHLAAERRLLVLSPREKIIPLEQDY
jgi:16S rRNA (guanine527-N7)-methyltransferase